MGVCAFFFLGKCVLLTFFFFVFPFHVSENRGYQNQIESHQFSEIDCVSVGGLNVTSYTDCLICIRTTH